MNRQPNIIYILADDMGYGDLSCLNAKSRIHTTHLDALAAGGMVFRDAHASSAVCTPSRYSILTGRYNWRSRLKEGVTFGYDTALIEPGRMTVASLLKENGYQTGCIGKWHLGWTWAGKSSKAGDIDYTQPIRNGPVSLGFDYFLGISASLDMPPYVYIENDRVTALPDRIVPAGQGKAFWREGPIAPDFRHEEVLPRLTSAAVKWIEHSSGQGAPFFLYFPIPAPHTPILPLPEFQGKSGTNAYGDFCLQVDDVVGQITTTLDHLGLADETIVIFSSDNGCSPMADFEELAGFGHQPSYVFRGHKADIYEGGHRIPLLVRWPAFIRPGSRSDATVCLVDLLATCAELVGAKLPDNAGEDSFSNLTAWQGAPADRPLREATVHHSIDGSFSIRKGKWKLEMCTGSGGWSHPRPGQESAGLPAIQLYNLAEDIEERHNIYAKHPQVVAGLQELLSRYVANGRSTPGARQTNTGGPHWKQLWWMPGNPSPTVKAAHPSGTIVVEIPREVPVVQECDVCVLGGSCTGVFAAVRAAQTGATVALVEKQNAFGGVAASGLVNVWHKLTSNTGSDLIIGGLTQLVLERLRKIDAALSHPEYGFLLNSEELKIELDRLVIENRVTPYLHTLYTAAQVEGDAIKAVFIENKNGRQAIRARVFVDATGDGDLARDAGLPFRLRDGLQPPSTCARISGLPPMARKLIGEHREEFGLALDHGWEAPVPGAPGVEMCAFTHVFNTIASDAAQLTAAEIEGRRQVRACMDIVRKYGGKHNRPCLLGLPSYIGVRETRSFEADYTLTEKDVLSCRRFPDAIANGTYHVDVHDPQTGQFQFKEPEGDFYQIPLSVMVSSRTRNLVLAGRIISTDRGAYGGIRVMVNLNQVGEAAGVAAAIAASGAQPVSSVEAATVRKQLSKLGAVII